MHREKKRTTPLNNLLRDCVWWSLLGFLWLAPVRGVQAACGDTLAETRRIVAAEAQALLVTEQTVRAAKAETRSREAALRKTILAHRLQDYQRELILRVEALRRAEVEIKLHMLERLHTQHEKSHQQWEDGYHLLPPQLATAHAAFQAQTLSADDYCSGRERYQQSLQLYRQGIQRYRAGMDLYAQALGAYGTRFLLPYTQGFARQQMWVDLIRQLEQGDFLHDILVPLAANVIHSAPPAVPPSRSQAPAMAKSEDEQTGRSRISKIKEK